MEKGNLMSFDGPVLGLDLETTGVDPHNDRIVTMAIVSADDTWHWHVDPGVPVPWEAARVHGITDTMIRFLRERRWIDHPIMALQHLCTVLDAHPGQPLVGMNISYDLTMLCAEARRHDLDGVAQRLRSRPVVDVYVLDQHLMPRQRGPRKLADLYRRWCDRDLDGAHDAAADTAAALDIWQAMRATVESLEPAVAEGGYPALHVVQQAWQYGLQEHRALSWGRGGAPGTFDPCWPICDGPARHHVWPHQQSSAGVPAGVGSQPAGWEDI